MCCIWYLCDDLTKLIRGECAVCLMFNVLFLQMELYSWDILTPIEAELAPTSKPANQKKEYTRHPKPPYSYLGMVATVIYNSENKCLTLRKICEALEELFPTFFRGPYRGWKDSIRHNLTYNSCFIKEHSSKMNSKANHWRVDLHLIPEDAFKRQVSGTKKLCLQDWGRTLHEHLGIPAVPIPYQYPALSSLTPVPTQASRKRKSMMDSPSALSVLPPTKRRSSSATSTSGINFSIRHILSSDSKQEVADSACSVADFNSVSPCITDGKKDNSDLAEAVNYVSSCHQWTGENLHRVCQDFEQSFRQICPSVNENSCSPAPFQMDAPIENPYDQLNPYDQFTVFQQSPYFHPTPAAAYLNHPYYMYSNMAQGYDQHLTIGQYQGAPQDVSYMQDSYTNQQWSSSDVPLDLS